VRLRPTVRIEIINSGRIGETIMGSMARFQRDPDGSAVRAACSPPHNIQAIIAGVARQEHVGLFPRFALMRRSIDAGLPAGAPISWDGLHNSAAGYDCVGRALARAIHAGGR
jgi:hypothetical protein